MELTDKDCIEKIRLGDKEAFTSLFKKYYEPLYYFVGRIIGDAQSSENIVQDIFVKIWMDRDSWQVASSVKAYLYTAVKNRALNYIKREKKKVYSFEELYQKENGLQTPEDEVIDRELYFKVHQVIDKLPEKCKRVYLMCHYDNLSYAEIAEIQNISLNTVKTHMKRALKILNKRLLKLM